MNRKLYLPGIFFICAAIIFLTACASTPTPTKSAASPAPEIVATSTAALPAPAAATTTSQTYIIFSNLGWDSLGMYVRQGQQFEISATGSWSTGPAENPTGPAGGDGFEPASTLPSAPIGALIGRIGHNPPFEIGEQAVLTADFGGEIYLGINDDPGALSDNAGSLEVTVTFGPRPATPTQLLTNEIDGYRLLVPAGYQAVVYNNGMCLTQSEGWMMACHVANVLIEVSQAAGRSLSQVAEEAAAQGNPDIPVKRSDLEVSGVQAIRLDDIYTYDVLRKVVMVSEDRVYILTFLPWGEEVEDFARLEELYNTVIGSFDILPSPDAAFLPPIPTAECPGPGEGTQLLQNEAFGYCFLYPEDYIRVDPLPYEVCLVPGEPYMACHTANLILEVEQAAGRTADQFADEVVADAESALPGILIERTNQTISGEQAVVLEGLPGVAASRNIYLVHADRLYKLVFVPWDETGEDFTRLETLYSMVINSFTLIP